MSELPNVTQEPVQCVDATPDAGYPLRILRVYRENCNCKWVAEPQSVVVDMMNKDCDKRAKILDRAIAVLEGGGLKMESNINNEGVRVIDKHTHDHVSCPVCHREIGELHDKKEHVFFQARMKARHERG